MTNPQIEALLIGDDEDNGLVRFEDFRTFCDKMAHCLRTSEVIVTRQSGRVRYKVKHLQASSAALTLEAIRPRKAPDLSAEVVRFFKKTVAELQDGSSVDPRLTSDDLKEFRALIASLKKTKQVWIEGKQVTSQYIANIDRILAATIASEGFVTGFLERLNVHNRNEFVLYPPILGAHVMCSFPDKMFEKVRMAIKHNVTVSGTLYYRLDKPFPDRVHVKALEVHPADNELPSLKSLRGLFRGSTNGMNATEFVRSLRNEQD